MDDFSWLKEREDPRVIAWLEAENRRTERAMKPTLPLRETLYRELVSRLQETDVSAPVHRGEWLYYRRTLAGKQYPIHCRRPAPATSYLAGLLGNLRAVGPGEDPAEQVLLDENALAEGHDYFKLGVFEPSPDGRHLAWSHDTNGAERFVLSVLDLTAPGGPRPLADRIENTSDGLAWAEDGKTFFYVTLDETRRPDRIWRHRLGAEPGQDTCVHHEPDGAFFASVVRTRSGRYLLAELESHTTREVLYLESDRPDGEFRPFLGRRKGVEYWLDHRGDHFYIRTNDGALNFRLLRAPVPGPGEPAPDPDRLEEVIPGRDDVKLEDALLFQDHLALLEREDGLVKLRVLELAGEEAGEERRVDFPEPAYWLTAGANHSFDDPYVRLRYSSPATPDTDYDYDLEERELLLVKRQRVPGMNAQEYTTTRIHARASDGTRIPISLFHWKRLERNGDNPCLLTGYGAYGMPYDARFDAPMLSLVDRGFVCAVAHVRGGGELGEGWHEQGKMLRKKNTFTDFVACAEHLIAEGWTRPEKLAIRGRSAGGLLIGAVLNLRPDLFRAAMAGVPFVDVYNTMRDPKVPLTVIEYEEWGNPEDPEYADYIRSYSPYENLTPGRYPHILVTAGLHDPRVQYWEPARWVARLRQVKRNGNHLLLRTEMGAGHGGPSGRYQALRERAFEYAFLLWALGVEEVEGMGTEEEAPTGGVVDDGMSEPGNRFSRARTGR